MASHLFSSSVHSRSGVLIESEDDADSDDESRQERVSGRINLKGTAMELGDSETELSAMEFDFISKKEKMTKMKHEVRQSLVYYMYVELHFSVLRK